MLRNHACRRTPSPLRWTHGRVTTLFSAVLVSLAGCGGGGGGNDELPGSVPSAVVDQFAAESAALQLPCPSPFLFYSSFDQGGGNAQPPATVSLANVSFPGLTSIAAPVKVCVTSPDDSDVPAAVKALLPASAHSWTRIEVVGAATRLQGMKVSALANYLAPLDQIINATELDRFVAVLPDGQGGWRAQDLPTQHTYAQPPDFPGSTQVRSEASAPGAGYFALLP